MMTSNNQQNRILPLVGKGQESKPLLMICQKANPDHADSLVDVDMLQCWPLQGQFFWIEHPFHHVMQIHQTFWTSHNFNLKLPSISSHSEECKRNTSPSSPFSTLSRPCPVRTRHLWDPGSMEAWVFHGFPNFRKFSCWPKAYVSLFHRMIFSTLNFGKFW